MTRQLAAASSVIVPVQRLPKEVGDLVLKFIAGEVTEIHLYGITRDCEVIEARAANGRFILEAYNC